jgi:hypothetical protein
MAMERSKGRDGSVACRTHREMSTTGWIEMEGDQIDLNFLYPYSEQFQVEWNTNEP